MELDNKLNDVMGSMFALAYNLSGLVAPIIGGYMYDNLSIDEDISYRKTMDFNMYFEWFMALFFLIFNCGRVFRDRQIQSEELEKMKILTLKLVQFDKSEVLRGS